MTEKGGELMKWRANVEPCENGYIVHIYQHDTDRAANREVVKTFVAKDEQEIVQLFKTAFGKGRKK
jgi:hypothetical protein